MQEYSAFIGIAAALAIGAASPGPSFVMVARAAASSSRLHGLSAAVGMGLGGFMFATLALMGLTAFLLAVPTLYLVMKLAGGVYLAYMGIKIWKSAKAPLFVVSNNAVTSNDFRVLRQVGLGLVTQLSNPKTAVVYASVFAAFLPKMSSLHFKLAIVILVFFIETTWYSLVATLLSAEMPRQHYLRFKVWIDRLAGGVMILLGLRLAASTPE